MPNKTAEIRARINEDLKERFKRKCKQNDANMSEQIIHAIKLYTEYGEQPFIPEPTDEIIKARDAMIDTFITGDWNGHKKALHQLAQLIKQQRRNHG